MPKIRGVSQKKTGSKTVKAEKPKSVKKEEVEKENKENLTPNVRTRRTAPLKLEEREKVEEQVKTPKTIVKLADRKFFTVAEDFQILTYFNQHRDQTSRQVSEALSKKINHSVESIRDRIKRFLSKLRKIDEEYLNFEAKKNPGHYVHFAKETAKKKRSITHISSEIPKLAGCSLKQYEKKAISKEHTRMKKMKFGALVGNTERLVTKDHIDFDNITTEEFFKLRQEREREQKENNTVYKGMLRKRNPVDYTYSNTEFLSPVNRRKEKYRMFFREKAMRLKLDKNDLKNKVQVFLDQLQSKNDEDVEVNAHILAEIIKSFSLTFGVTNDEITEILREQKDGLNIEEFRKVILNRVN